MGCSWVTLATWAGLAPCHHIKWVFFIKPQLKNVLGHILVDFNANHKSLEAVADIQERDVLEVVVVLLGPVGILGNNGS